MKGSAQSAKRCRWRDRKTKRNGERERRKRGARTWVERHFTNDKLGDEIKKGLEAERKTEGRDCRIRAGTRAKGERGRYGGRNRNVGRSFAKDEERLIGTRKRLIGDRAV